MATLLIGISKVLTAKEIVQLLGKAIATKAVEWARSKIFDYVGLDDQRSDITKKLISIETELENVKLELNKITFEIQWEHLNTRINNAVTGIRNMYHHFRTVMSLENNMREVEWAQLKTAILDIRNGVINDLLVIHEVLVGTQQTNPSAKGLLEMWSRGISDNLAQNPMFAFQYQNALSNYLKNFVLLQYMGAILFVEASDNIEYCIKQLSWINNNIECQIKVSENMTPAAMKYLKDPDGHTSFYLSSAGTDVRFHEPLRSIWVPFVREILFEETKTEMTKHGITVPQDLCRSDDVENPSSEWIFEKSDNGDGICIYGKEYTFANSGFSYITVKDNLVYSNGEKKEAERFYIMPLLTSSSNAMEIMICSCHGNKRFLGSCNGRIECVNERGNIRFGMTKASDCATFASTNSFQWK